MSAPQPSHVEKLMAECDRATARTLAIEEIRALHDSNREYVELCEECGQPWPCDTAAILERHSL